MSLLDVLTNNVGRLTKLVNTIEEKYKRVEEDVRDLRKENSELRKEVSTLIARVAVLEEARKTTAAEVKAAVTESLATWERQKMREERDELRNRAIPPGE